MELQKCFNTTPEDIKLKKYNILIPICLGNKFFVEWNKILNYNLENYINWSLKHTKSKVLILIADKIQYSNYMVRKNYKNKQESIRAVLEDGKEIKRNVSKILSKYSDADKNRINLIDWNDFEKYDPHCVSVTNLVHQKFKLNDGFKKAVIEATKKSVNDRDFDHSEYVTLSNYVLDEFSVVYNGAEYKGDYYGLYIYPQTDEVVYLIEDIKEGKRFDKIKKELPQRTVALGILNN